MASDYKGACLAGPAFASSQYERGPTDTNSAMFPFEKKQAEAIEARCGKTTSPQDDNRMSNERQNIPAR